MDLEVREIPVQSRAMYNSRLKSYKQEVEKLEKDFVSTRNSFFFCTKFLEMQIPLWISRRNCSSPSIMPSHTQTHTKKVKHNWTVLRLWFNGLPQEGAVVGHFGNGWSKGCHEKRPPTDALCSRRQRKLAPLNRRFDHAKRRPNVGLISSNLSGKQSPPCSKGPVAVSQRGRRGSAHVCRGMGTTLPFFSPSFFFFFLLLKWSGVKNVFFCGYV